MTCHPNADETEYHVVGASENWTKPQGLKSLRIAVTLPDPAKAEVPMIEPHTPLE